MLLTETILNKLLKNEKWTTIVNNAFMFDIALNLSTAFYFAFMNKDIWFSQTYQEEPREHQIAIK